MTRSNKTRSGLLVFSLLFSMTICGGAFAQDLWMPFGTGTIKTDNSIQIGEDGASARIFINPNSLRYNLRNQTPGPMVVDYGPYLNFRQGPAGGPSTFFIDTVGNFGIGTTTPQSKLAVNGTVTAKEVIVTEDNWPDFVFRDDYDLLPLDELEERILAEGHLPGIPAAGQVAENGVGLGQMQAKLLQKVEELTLYMIELKKQNDELRSRLETLAQSK